MTMRREFRLCGSGGQGLILASIILAEASALYGCHVVQTQSYGPEARGGASKAEVIAAAEPIDHPKVTQPDVILIMSVKAYQKYGGDVKPGSLLLLDSTFINDGCRVDAVHLPITRQARQKLGSAIAANIVALGALNTLSRAVPQMIMEQAVLKRAPRGTEALNREALRLGIALAEQTSVIDEGT